MLSFHQSCLSVHIFKLVLDDFDVILSSSQVVLELCLLRLLTSFGKLKLANVFLQNSNSFSLRSILLFKHLLSLPMSIGQELVHLNIYETQSIVSQYPPTFIQDLHLCCQHPWCSWFQIHLVSWWARCSTLWRIPTKLRRRKPRVNEWILINNLLPWWHLHFVFHNEKEARFWLRPTLVASDSPLSFLSLTLHKGKNKRWIKTQSF